MTIIITTAIRCDMCDFELDSIVSSKEESEDMYQLARELGWELLVDPRQVDILTFICPDCQEE